MSDKQNEKPLLTKSVLLSQMQKHQEGITSRMADIAQLRQLLQVYQALLQNFDLPEQAKKE